MPHTSFENARWFRSMAPYINAHRNKIFVLAFNGEALLHSNFSNLLHDIALLNSLGVQVVIVHGCRPQIDSRLRLSNVESSYKDGLRVTGPDIINHVIDAALTTRNYIESKLSMGLPNSPMQGSKLRVSSGNFVAAHPLGIVDGTNLQFTGQVRRVDFQAITHQLGLGAIVLQSPLGYSSTGETFNLSIEDVAVAISSEVNADKLILFGEHSGLLSGNKLIRQCRTSEMTKLKLIDESQRWLVGAAIRACSTGVSRSHIISYVNEGALLEELFTHDGAGTLVTEDEYEKLRTATIEDIGGILELLHPLEEEGILVKRSRKLLEEEISQFRLLDRDGRIIACAALYPFKEEEMAEIACVVTHANYQGKSRGSRLLEMLEKEALDMDLKTLFVLTTQTAHWFLEKGFMETSMEQLPKSRQSIYNLQRNSKVFFKTLT